MERKERKKDGRENEEKKARINKKSASTSTAGQQQTGSPSLLSLGFAMSGATIIACGRDDYALLVGSAAVRTLWMDDALDVWRIC